MIRILIIGAVVYISWVILYLCRKKIKRLFGFKDSDKSQKEVSFPPFDDDDEEIMGKSHFVLSQPQPHTDTVLETEKVIEKEDTFVPPNELQPSGVIPNEQLDETFSDTQQPIDIEVTMEYEEEKEVDFDEEAEELRELMGRDADLAGGFSYDEMKSTAMTIEDKEATNEAEIQAGEVLHKTETTQIHEQLISGDAERASRVAYLIDLHLEQYNKKVTDKENRGSSGGEDEHYKMFDITNYIKKKN